MAIEHAQRLVCDVCGKKTRWEPRYTPWMFALSAAARGWTSDHFGVERLKCPDCKEAGDPDDT